MTLRTILTTLLLAVTWVLLTGYATIGGAIVGLLVGLIVATLAARSIDAQRAPNLSGFPALLVFIADLIRQILIADIDVARRILADDDAKDAGLVEIAVKSPYETAAALSAHAITAAPGSLVVDFKDDGQTMIVHMLDTDGREQIEREQATRAERLEKLLGKGETTS